ncbi:hypothetical protein L4G92_05930 [Neisseria sp. ZJ106]|uniref:Lipoprotein n=1 Tax=Neisseria lisongii TaxID=2912188 RepID=A0ABY7RKJ1_9NEIS|nr:hypothetical protein [Neisseria lisongii]MCF7521585.1 hypothetical protein [Neisseria lisongii]WCL71813.1 hypothetical protein PJU73_01400 [Neisseria lisongii]
MKLRYLSLMIMPLLSACGGLPACDSKEARNLIEQIINQRSIEVGKFVKLDEIEESAYGTIPAKKPFKYQSLRDLRKNENGELYVVGESAKVDEINAKNYNEKSEVRVCTADLITTYGTENITYNISWQDKDQGMFEVEVR